MSDFVCSSFLPLVSAAPFARSSPLLLHHGLWSPFTDSGALTERPARTRERQGFLTREAAPSGSNVRSA